MTKDPEKRRVQKAKWYRSHAVEHIARVARRNEELKRENRQRILAYLKEHPCVDCGETDPIVLDFDHVRGKKKAPVSRLLKCDWSIVWEEIQKCEVRCANDHRRATFGRRSTG
jgi:hypothetical protein